MDVAERIVWSADVPDETSVVEHLDLMPDLNCIKIDRLFTDRHSRYILALLKDRGLNVFYDAKFVEIPSKLEELVREVIQYEPWMVNCMAGSVSNGDMSVHEERDLMDGLRRFADICRSGPDIRPCGVTVLTSKTEGVVASEFNGRSAMDQVLWYVERLVEAQFTDVVCSPKEVPAIRERFDDAIELNTPGIRFADSDAGDQARVATPGKAIEGGTTRVIMGRPLHSGDPAENFRRASNEIAAVLAAA